MKISNISSDISNIGDERHDIGNQQLFEGKIGKKSVILAIYRYLTDISVDISIVRQTRRWKIF